MIKVSESSDWQSASLRHSSALSHAGAVLNSISCSSASSKLVMDTRPHLSHILPLPSQFFSPVPSYCLTTQAQRCEQLAQRSYEAVPEQKLSMQPFDHKSAAISQLPNDMHGTSSTPIEYVILFCCWSVWVHSFIESDLTLVWLIRVVFSNGTMLSLSNNKQTHLCRSSTK